MFVHVVHVHTEEVNGPSRPPLDLSLTDHTRTLQTLSLIVGSIRYMQLSLRQLKLYAALITQLHRYVNPKVGGIAFISTLISTFSLI